MIPFVKDFPFTYGAPDEAAPRVQRVIARNPGPFTYTGSGTYIVGDGTACVVIDPGPDDAAHMAAIAAALPGPCRAILITHTHRDHCGGTEGLKAETGAEILAFGAHPNGPDKAAPALDEGADHDFTYDRKLADGERIAVPGGDLLALHTPGHCANHLCFLREADGVLFSGDHVMGWSTTVVAPPDGDMADYMASLDRLRARDLSVILPTHGAPITEPAAFLDALRAHRMKRDLAIGEALTEAFQSPIEIVRTVYEDVDPALHEAAALNVRAHCDWHVARGQAREDEGLYARR